MAIKMPYGDYVSKSRAMKATGSERKSWPAKGTKAPAPAGMKGPIIGVQPRIGKKNGEYRRRALMKAVSK